DQGDYELIVEVPGHLDSVNPIEISKEVDGERVGTYITNFEAGKNVAGDINQDEVIEIMDAMRIVAMYENDDEQTDINQDGIIDETDIRFVEKNFLRVSPGTDKEPTEKLGMKGLDDLLQSIGL